MALPLAYNVRNVIVRWKVTLLAIGGIALVVGVMLILVAMSNGFRVAVRSTGAPDNAIVVQRGAMSELNDACSRESAALIMVDGRIARDNEGHPLASPEIVIVNNMARRQDNNFVNVVVRGVTLTAFKVRNNVRVTEGRRSHPDSTNWSSAGRHTSATSVSISATRSSCSDETGRSSACLTLTGAGSRAKSGAIST
jgi:putative ABC transport system permease protein